MKISDQDECVLCCREITIFAIGACDHPVCYECSARMRVLCETNECPICRSNTPMVIWTYECELFTDVFRKFSHIDKKYQITFEDAEVQNSFNLLLENKCRDCDEIFNAFNKLRDHVRRKHDLHYCELCTENLKIFSFEKKVYNRKDLARHKRVGDPDDTSHRGHPLCEFCDQRYVDNDELFRHLRREHYFCHFCDADGKHQYYEDYNYLRVHFRKEHYLCEEGDCANEQFIGAFRSEIDLKAHIAVHHSKNKSKAEVRQARMLEFEFTYAHHNRPSGSSSPRGGRYHQHRKQNVEENNTRDNKSNQTVEIEKINTDSTQDFPFLSEEGASGSTSNLNSVTLQSFNRNPVPTRPNKVMSAEDFPALVSTTVNVTSEVTNNQGRKINVSVNRQNNAPVKTSSMSIHLSQKAKSSESNNEKRDPSNKQPSWISKQKHMNFEDDFPKLLSKKAPVTFTNVVNTTVVNNVQSCAPSTTVVPVVTHSSNGDQFVIIKGKSKKKKHNKTAWSDGKSTDEIEESVEKDDLSDRPNILSNNNFNLLEQEDKDTYKRNVLKLRNNYVEEDAWHPKVSFGKNDFPPLAPSEVNRKPAAFNPPKKKAPPPGFNMNSNTRGNSAPLNISLSTIARQLEASDLGNLSLNEIPKSDSKYKSPPNLGTRNENLIKRIKELSNAQKSMFNEFKGVSGEFRQSEIPASEYHTKCLEILGEKGFCDIFPELVALLPDINKQQELLDVHRRYQSRQNSSGAVPKQKLLNNDPVSVCDICYQVLLESDHPGHKNDHQRDVEYL